MKVGFTGSRRGMTDMQRLRLAGFLSKLNPDDEFHHGDCVGADEQAHNIAKHNGLRVVVHPPSDDSQRAWCEGDENLTPRPYLGRNQDIVDETIVLFAAPHGPEEQRSGTWSTVRYARKIGRHLHVIYPDGRVE